MQEMSIFIVRFAETFEKKQNLKKIVGGILDRTYQKGAHFGEQNCKHANMLGEI